MTNDKDKDNGDETRAEVLELLERELRDKAARIRSSQIPQKVGMAAAARIAADRLFKHLTALVQAQVSDDRLAKQWAEIRKRAGEDGEVNEADALATLLVSQATLVREWLTSMASNNEADAHRLEGQAVALENEAEAMTSRAARARLSSQSPARREEGERPISLLEARRSKDIENTSERRNEEDAPDA